MTSGPRVYSVFGASSEGARDTPVPVRFVHDGSDGWVMDYPALSGSQERNPSPSSACFTILNPMPSSTEEPHTHSSRLQLTGPA